FKWDKPLSFSSLDRHRTTPLVNEKIFQCPKQIRTKASLFPADGSQVSVLQQICEKSLGDIFCLLRSSALSLHEAVDRTPINAAKFFQGFLRSGRFTLCLYHDTPVSSTKQRRLFACARYRTI